MYSGSDFDPLSLLHGKVDASVDKKKIYIYITHYVTPSASTFYIYQANSSCPRAKIVNCSLLIVGDNVCFLSVSMAEGSLLEIQNLRFLGLMISAEKM